MNKEDEIEQNIQKQNKDCSINRFKKKMVSLWMDLYINTLKYCYINYNLLFYDYYIKKFHEKSNWKWWQKKQQQQHNFRLSDMIWTWYGWCFSRELPHPTLSL